MRESFGRHKLNAGLLDLGDIEGADVFERKRNFELQIAQLHKDRRIGDATVVIISMHGGDGPTPEDQVDRIEKMPDEVQSLSDSDSVKHSTYTLSVLDRELEFDFHWLIGRIRNTMAMVFPTKVRYT